MIRKTKKEDRKAKAIEFYEKFLDLWMDADPGIAEVEGGWVEKLMIFV